MYPILKHAHSGIRWIVLILLILAIVGAFRKWQGKQPYGEGDRKISLFAFISTHVQFVLGLILYFISPYVHFTSGVMKETMLRFYTVEHITLMIFAIGLITVGYSRAKKKATDLEKHKTTFWFYLIGLVLILAAIPWPFRNLGAGWF